MNVTSQDLLDDLHRMDHLILTLSTLGPLDEEDDADLRWLREQRRFVRHVLAVRRAQRRRKIVSLDLWRYGEARRHAA